MRTEDWRASTLVTLGLSALTYAGLFAPLSRLNFSGIVSVDTTLGGQMKAGLFAAVFLLLWLRRYTGTLRKFYNVLSGSCALCVLLNRSFMLQSNWALLFGSWGAFLSALWVWGAMTIVLQTLMSLLKLACRRSLAKASIAPQREKKAPVFSYVLTMCILLLCWLPHIIMQAPGAIETTAGQQIRQIFGELPYTRDNPVFHTLLMKVLLKGSLAVGFSDSMAVLVVSLSQVIPMAAALSWTVSIVRRLPLPRFAAGTLTAFYALCPIFPLYGMFIVKDVPFAICVVLFTCLTTEVILQRDAFFASWRRLALFILIGSLTCLMRNVAVALFALTGFALFFSARLSPKAQKRFLLCSLAVLAIYGGFTAGANQLLHIGTLETRQAETRSLQCQMIARVVREHETELSDSERSTIDACLPMEGLPERYNPEVSDPVKDTWRTGVTGEQSRALDALTLRMMLRYPADCAQAVLQMGIPYLTPGDIGRFRSIFDCGFSNIDALYAVFKPKFLFPVSVFRSTLDFFQHERLLNFFLCGGIYAWMLITCLATLARHQKRRLIPSLLPALLVLTGCLFSPVAGYVRYALPFIYCAPFLTLTTLSEFAPLQAVAGTEDLLADVSTRG